MLLLGALVSDSGLSAAPASPADFPPAWDSFREGERHVQSGDLTAALGSFSAARKAMARAVPLDPALRDALATDLYNLAVSLTSASRLDEALRCFEELYLLRLAGGRLRDDAFETTVRDGAEKIAAYAVTIGKPRGAATVYAVMLRIDPHNAKLRLALAGALLAAGDLTGASREAAAVRKADRRSAEAPAVQARVDLAAAGGLISKGDHREGRIRIEWGLQGFEEAMRLQADSPDRIRELVGAATLLARAYREEGDIEGAAIAAEKGLAAVEEGLRISAATGDLLLARARLLDAAGRIDDVPDAATRAAKELDLAGDGARAAEARSLAVSSLGEAAATALGTAQFDLAAQKVSRMRQVDPSAVRRSDASARMIEDQRARHDKVLRDGKASLDTSPGKGDALLALGDLHFRYGRYDEALAYYERLSRTKQDRPAEDLIRDRLFRARRTSMALLSFELSASGTTLRLELPAEALLPSLRDPAATAWTRTVAALGAPAAPPPAIVVRPNERAFRLTDGVSLDAAPFASASQDTVAVFEAPKRDAEAWTAVLTKAYGLWSCQVQSRRRAPRWFCQGAALWAALPAGAGSRRVPVRPVDGGGWVPVDLLEEAIALSRGDGERGAALRDEALALVGVLAASKGDEAPGKLIRSLGEGPGAPLDETLRKVFGISTAGLEKAVLRRP